MKETTWLISYPRSGSTWLRFLIAHVLYPLKKDVSWHDLERIVPDAEQSPDNLEGKVAKCHIDYDVRYHRAIYLYRDGRDVALSYFYYLQGDWTLPKFRINCSWPDFFDLFLKGIVADGSWKGHVNLWTNVPHGVETLFISYERMLVDGVNALKEVCDFANIPSTPEICERAVERTHFTKIKKKAERDGQHPYTRGLRGTSGGWKSVFTSEQTKRFWDWAGDLMTSLGYNKEGT